MTQNHAPSLPLVQRLEIHNLIVHRVRKYIQDNGYVEVPVPELTAATGSCEVVDSMFTLDYFGALAFPRQTGQLFLEEMVAAGLDAVYCEGESLRKEWKVDNRHLTEFKLIEIERRDMSLVQLCDFQEALLKDVAAHLLEKAPAGADLDACYNLLAKEHPRLSYREALELLNRHGWSLSFGEDLERRAEAELVALCGNLPVHVTRYPESLKFFNMKIDRSDPLVVECVDYILPHSGETFGGSVREPDHEILQRRLYEGTMYTHLMNRASETARALAAASDSLDETALADGYRRNIQKSFEGYLDLFRAEPTERAGFGLGVARLIQFVLGMDSIKDAVVFPMDRTCFQATEVLAEQAAIA